jgi:hypothetical protein
MTNVTDFATGMVLLLLVLAVVVFFWRWSQRNIKATEERIKKYQAHLEVDTPATDAPRGVVVSEVQSPEITRELAEEVDAKIANLYRLLNAAEEQSARLERAIAEAKRLGQ